MGASKGFIKDWSGNKILPITRGELVLDQDGNIALNSKYFLAGLNGAQYGLVTAAERAMLSGGGGSGTVSIGDLANKLNYINTGLYFNNTPLNFYNASGTATPISITASNGVTLITQNNSVNFGLTALTTSDTTISQIIKSITIDKYGRVIAVSGSALTNAEIPTELSGKTISNSTLTGCTTSEKEIGTDEKAIVNKAYVDAKFKEVTGIASGSLHFGGPLNDADQANACLQALHQNKFFKVTKEFYLNVSSFYNSPEVGSSGTFKVKVGDTLIVYSTNSVYKFVYIPSGDDITTITVGKSNSSNALNNAIGNVNLQFDGCFDVINPIQGSNTAKISIAPASTANDGYLTKEDYNKFSSYKTVISYTGEFSSGNGVYKIGTLSVNNVDNIIYGINNISQLSLTDGTTNAYNPILKFTETGQNDVDITLQGYNGIFIKKDGDSIRIGSEIEDTSKKYFNIDSNNKLKVIIGSIDLQQNKVNDGLVDFNTLYNFMLQLSDTTVFEKIDYSLKGTDSTKYQYGNDKLIEAITVTI